MLVRSNSVSAKQKIIKMLHRILYQIFEVFQSLYKYLLKILHPAQTIQFEDGLTVTISHKIAEGGFSYIFCATDVNRPQRKYALKRMICGDEEMFHSCRKEVDVHRRIQAQNGHGHSNLLYLFHVKFIQETSQRRLCYMLFPLVSGGSLRDHVTKRNLLSNDLGRVRPWSERQVLKLFKGILEGVRGLHNSSLAHCDIKLENVLLDQGFEDEDNGRGSGSGSGSGAHRDGGDIEMRRGDNNLGIPILMDFGSARELEVKLVDRRSVLRLTEDAAQYSTICYRAPELFEGGCRHGPLEAPVDGKVDVWSCGCLLFGMIFGTSPFELEFRQDGSTKIVECTHLRVLGGTLPRIPTVRASLYNHSKDIIDLIQWILTVDRKDRPNIDEVCDRVEALLTSATRSRSRMAFSERGDFV